MSETLEAFIEHIAVIKGLSDATITAYQSDLQSIEQEVGNLLSLDQEKVLSLMAHQNNKRTLNRKLSSLNAFFRFCYESEFTQETMHFKLAKMPKYLPKYLEIDEIRKGLSLIDRSNWMGMRDYALILFLFASGVRISEALKLEKDDLNENWVKVRFAKGDKERIVPIATEAQEAIDTYMQARPKESRFIWINYQGKALSRISAFKITQKYLQVSPHVLRHSYATAMILGGADLRVVQELLGHASMLTTQIYTHIEKEVLRDSMLRFHPLRKLQ